MSYIKILDSRFETEMWQDTRLVEQQGNFCLCTVCAKNDEDNGLECPIHKRFMQATRYLMVGAPIFTCVEFVDDVKRDHPIDHLYNPTMEEVDMTAAWAYDAYLKSKKSLV